MWVNRVGNKNEGKRVSQFFLKFWPENDRLEKCESFEEESIEEEREVNGDGHRCEDHNFVAQNLPIEKVPQRRFDLRHVACESVGGKKITCVKQSLLISF